MNIDFFGVIQTFAEASMKDIHKEPGDYTNEDGILYCHKCNEPKTKVVKSVIGGETYVTLWGRKCKCVRDAEEKTRGEEAKQKHANAVESLKRSSMIDGIFKEAGFDKYTETASNKNNLKICRRYVDRFDMMLDNSQGMLFWGQSGTGKSFTAACIANALMEQEVPVLMTSFVRILDSCRLDPDFKDQFIKRISKKKLVIFDDLGAERATDYALEQVYDIVDTRYRNRLPMIFTTNLTLDEMKNEQDVRFARIYDRIFETCYPLEFKGKSWRKMEAKKRWQEMKSLLEE